MPRKAGSSAGERDARGALGCSRGVDGTKACVIADGRGRATAFALAPGQAHELPQAPGLLNRLLDVPGWVVGDRGFASGAFRERIRDMGTARDTARADRRSGHLPRVRLMAVHPL